MAKFTKGTLVTIIGESVLQERLIHLFTQLKVSGYTLIPAKGAGSHGRRMGDVAAWRKNLRSVLPPGSWQTMAMFLPSCCGL